MKGILNHSQIEYVLNHLGHHIILNDTIKKSFIYVKPGEDISVHRNKILFLLSEKQFDPFKISHVGEIPVLFPVKSGTGSFASLNSNIIFNNDLLKSAFYLLSGYQERDPGDPDLLGRFTYQSSIQSHLNITTKPVVNYYFDAIISGIHEFCRLQDIKFARRKLFDNFAFFLTHDVDRISYYNLNSLLNTLKQLTGLLKTGKTKSYLLKEALNIGSHIIYNPDRKDPFWNFSFLSDLEKKLGICSTWFFLPEDQKHIDSYYKLTEQKISELIRFLINEGHEIGLHGTVRSYNSFDTLVKIKNELVSVTGQNDTGIRQHRLMWKHPDTALFHEEAGIVYDTTLGFAGYEGFRNSYCHPFRLFDFEKDRMLSYWEIPLNVMESTLFDYRNLEFGNALKAINQLLGEISAFNGVFTLLWHNNYFDEVERPGITGFYTGLLERIMSEKPEVLTGMEIIKKLT
jgi:peptidoglycan/xylan/chitin deacetylase (PgdA/CDA1 family)